MAPSLNLNGGTTKNSPSEEEVVRLREMLFNSVVGNAPFEERDDEVAVPFVGQYEWWLQQIDRSGREIGRVHN